MDIELINLKKSYEHRSRVIFNNLNVRFAAGKVSVILGKSGKGKSSLLNLIAGIDLPDQGEIRIGGQKVSAMDDTDRTLFRRRHIGFVFQSFNLIPVLTVLENVSLVSHLDGRAARECEANALALIAAVGLEDRAHAFPDRLSGGEQQRVAIARALANDPDIILADEPTGNLDTRTGEKVLDILCDTVERQGKTLVMVTHSRDAAAHAHELFTVENQDLVSGGLG